MLEHPHKWSDLTVQGSSLWIGSNTQGIHKVPVRTSGFFQMLFFHVMLLPVYWSKKHKQQ